MAIDGKKTSEETQLNAADLTGAELIRLARGGANYAVSAAEFYSFIVLSNSIVSIGLTTFNSIQSAGFLSPMTWYYITDLRCYVFALTGNIVLQDGVAEKDVPYSAVNYGAVSLWANGGAYVITETVVYGNFVYLSTSNQTSTIPPPDDGANWTLETLDSIYYRIEFVKCRFIKYNDLTGFFIDYYVDQYGNETNDITFPAYNCFYNKIDRYSFVFIYGGVRGIVYGNELKNNSILNVNNQLYGDFHGNSLKNAAIFCIGELLNYFYDNVIECVDLYLSAGDGGEMSNCFIRLNDRATTPFNIRANQIIRNARITSEGSSLVDMLDGSLAAPSNVLDLNYNGTNDAYGIFEITTADITIDSLSGFPVHFEKIILQPAAGITITSISLAASVVSSHGQIVDNGIGAGNCKVIGDSGDYLVISRRVVNGFNVYFVEQNIILP